MQREEKKEKTTTLSKMTVKAKKGKRETTHQPGEKGKDENQKLLLRKGRGETV